MNIPKPKPYPKDGITRIRKSLPLKTQMRWTLCNFTKEMNYRHSQNGKNFMHDCSDIYTKYVKKIIKLTTESSGIYLNHTKRLLK